MSKTVIAFGASNSKNSINKKFAAYAASSVSGATVKLLDLNDYEMPIYSIDREKEDGIPQLAHQFKNEIANSDGIVISFAEHNSSYSVAFKNILDWISRIDKNIWSDKPMFLLSTSPGGRGGKTVLEVASNSFSRMNENTITSFSLPSFHLNFGEQGQIKDESLRIDFEEQLEIFTGEVVAS